ncbi:MAG: DNA recombination protein RmuC [Saprospiraceae bacterium]|nr:DNA recombination protein RmuC [Candidatus Brachybacter algidus]
MILCPNTSQIKTHIDELSKKEYDSIEKSLDFVMLFVPIEPAFMTAIHFDQQLWNYAYKKRILLISPTNLIALCGPQDDGRHLEKGASECQRHEHCEDGTITL